MMSLPDCQVPCRYLMASVAYTAAVVQWMVVLVIKARKEA